MKQIWSGGILLVLTLFVLAACGTKTVDSIHPIVRSADLGKEKTIVILPFSDYTPSDSPAGYWHRNILIMEALQDEILRYGYMPAVSENVLTYLSEKNIILKTKGAELPPESSADKVIKAELAKDWSPGMKAELMKALAFNREGRKQDDGQKRETANFRSIALDHKAIKDIGRAFNADYVVRGRIMVFKNGREDSFNPLQTGVLPFFFNTGSRALFGIAESDQYEMIDKIAIGGLVGALAAPGNWPVEGSSDTSLSGHPRLGGGLVTTTESMSGLNSAIWGLAGSGLAYLAHNGGRVDNAVVQLRMMVQDTNTGQILWTNRAEVKAMTESAFSKKDGETLISQAVQTVCGRLFDNFVATENHRRIVRRYDDGTLYVTPIGGLKPLRDQCDPYYPIQVDSPAQVAKQRTSFQSLSGERKTDRVEGR